MVFREIKITQKIREKLSPFFMGFGNLQSEPDDVSEGVGRLMDRRGVLYDKFGLGQIRLSGRVS